MGELHRDPHLFEHEADLAADILALIIRCDVHISGAVAGCIGALAVGAVFEKIKLHLRAEGKAQPARLRLRGGALQKGARVPGRRRAVGVGHVAEHAHDAPGLRPPGEADERPRVRVEEKIGAHRAAEARDRRSVKRDAVAERALKLRRHDGDILLPPVSVAERKADKLHIRLTDIFHYLLRGVLHLHTLFR